MSLMEVMDPTGHTSVEWDAENNAEVEIARSTFEMMTGPDKKYQAFRVDQRGGQGERMRSFDPSAEKILLIPQLKGG